MCQKWFSKFRAGDFSLKDAPRSDSPVVDEIVSDERKTLLDNNQRYTSAEISNIFKMSLSNVEGHLHQHDYINRFDMWLPLELSEKHLMDRVSVCDSLMKRNESVPFLKQIVTSCEKCFFYSSVKWKRPRGEREEPLIVPKADLHPKKVMLCIWWDWKGVLYYQLFPENQTIDSIKYCSQLDK